MTSLRRYATWATASFASMVLNLRFIGLPRPLLLAGPACGRPTPVRRAEARRFQQHEGRKQRRPVPGSHRDVTLITGAERGRRGTDCSRVAPASRRHLFSRKKRSRLTPARKPARRRRYIMAPVTRRVSSHLYWSRPFHTSTTKTMLLAIQYRSIFGRVRLATYGTEISRRPFVQLAAIQPVAGPLHLLPATTCCMGFISKQV